MFDPVIFLPLLLAMVSTASANVTTKLVPVVETIPDPTPSVGEFWIDEDKSIPLRLTTVTHIDASQSTTVVPVIISSPKVDEIVHQSVAVFTVPGQVAPSPSSSDHNGTHHIPVVEEEHSGNSQHVGPTTVYQTVYLPSPSSTSTWSTAYEDSVTIVLTVYVNNAAATASTSTSSSSTTTSEDTHETPTTEHEHEGDDTTTSEADGTQEPQEQESPDIVHVHVQARDSNMDNIDNNINLVAQGCRDRNPKGWITLSGTRSNPNPTYGPPLTWPQHCDGGVTFITAIRKMPSFITSTSIDNAAATPMITAAPAPSSHPELEPTDSSDSEKHESLDAGGDIMTAHVTRTPAQTSYSTRTLTCGNRIRDNDRGTVVNMKHKRIEDNINAEEHNAISIIAEHNITEVQQALVSLAVQDGGKDGDFWSEIGDGIKEGVERFGNDVVEGLNNPICFLIPCHHAKFGDHAHRDHHG